MAVLRDAVRMLVWLGSVVGACLLCAWLATDARYALPDDVRGTAAWLASTPVDAATGLALRGLALAGAYLVLVTALGVLARLTGAVRAMRLLDTLSPAVARRLAAAAVSASIGAAPMAPVIAQPLPGGEVAQEPLIVSPAAAPLGSPPAMPAPARVPRSPLRPPVAPDEPARTTGPADGGSTTAGGSTGGVGDDPAASTWRVEPGDHLWAIASSVVADREGGEDPKAVDAYWRRLVDANRHRLLCHDDPDLIVPGQELELPA